MERQEAIALGLKRYNTGRPCVNGHTADLLVAGHGRCTRCQYEAKKRWVVRNPEKHRESNRAWMRTRRKHGYNEAAKIRMRNYYRKKKGIPPATRPQPERCENAACGRLLLPGKTHLDHDHKTGAFRGWLCNRCNLGIGMLGDTVAGMEGAIAYLRRALLV